MALPFQVGITGGIGSGKSLVCHIFRCLGVPAYDADSSAKNLMTSDPVLVDQIKSEFGQDSYLADGRLDRTYIGKLTFGSPEKLEMLNQLVHPRVAIDYSNWVASKKGHTYLLKEAALLYEAGSYSMLDKIIVVSAPESLRIQRVRQRDPQRTEADVKAIMKNQWPDSEKEKRADYIIHNDDGQMVIPQVLELHRKFLSGG